MSHDDIQHHVKTYIKVFMALMFFTLLTVYASYVEFDLAPGFKAGAIFVGLFIAIVKGALVATQFMHLNNEKKIIYWVLGLTIVFFTVCLSIPVYGIRISSVIPILNNLHLKLKVVTTNVFKISTPILCIMYHAFNRGASSMELF